MNAVRNAWYVAAWSSELGRKPFARTLLGRHVMLIRTREGVVGLGAQCPHRHADLSTGEFGKGRIRCPYHGWSFDMQGRCVEVPGTSRVPKAACLPRYPARERQGMIWVWFGEGEPTPSEPPSFEFSPSQRMRRQRTPPRLWEVSYVDLVENTLDPTHITATHARTLGSRWAEHVGLMTEIEQRSDGGGFVGRAGKGGEHTGFSSLGRNLGLAQLITPPIPRSAEYRFEFGGAVYARYHYGGSDYDYAFAAITPKREGETWLFAEVGRCHRLSALGDLMQYAAMRVLQREDYGVVKGLIHDDVRGPGEYVGTANDRMMNTFRTLHARRVRAEAAAPAEGSPPEPPRPPTTPDRKRALPILP
ncbi:vanillate O-demethylase oxygenase, putative [Plesiocystis pacifica SIR-1]|uniref:Vanillate O-demethylase oxygenase, putative n=1 Tax=Plesiocystis pacifica SIR-1 TaxID=391625 RepID=A6GA22_9BACT|nr:Rieske 2Fe-2S domain-containing protein [Plesiocystis pacifica]EDM77235.1 vanillate O-demethylase oxygenase, putative [Plesiocystis pacifica SIR-1]